jgi:hypothetical protein
LTIKRITSGLAKAGDPLTDVNGEILEPEEDDDWEAPVPIPVPSTPVPFKAYRPIARRVMSELRAPSQAVNVSLVILGYTLLGISDAEICEATNLTGEQVSKVRDSRTYSDAFELIMRELISANSEYVECRLAAYSGMALNNVADIARTAKNRATKLAANKDLLDRAGHRPQDQATKQNSGMNELHIVITTPDDRIEAQIDFKGGNSHANGSQSR